MYEDLSVIYLVKKKNKKNHILRYLCELEAEGVIKIHELEPGNVFVEY